MPRRVLVVHPDAVLVRTDGHTIALLGSADRGAAVEPASPAWQAARGTWLPGRVLDLGSRNQDTRTDCMTRSAPSVSCRIVSSRSSVSPVRGSILICEPSTDCAAGTVIPSPWNTALVTARLVPSDLAMAARITCIAATP